MTDSGSIDTAPVDQDTLDEIRRRLAKSDRFLNIDEEPEDNPDKLKCNFDLRYYPQTIDEVYLDITWYQNSDFNIHYHEKYSGGRQWECRWDRHPNDHNDRGHYHPGPDATKEAATNDNYPRDWRDVLERILKETDERMRGFWE